MPQAPLLPAEAMAQAQSTAGLNPANFLIAAADMHNSGQLSAPVPAGKDPVPANPKSGRRKANLRILK